MYDEFGLLRATIEPEAVNWLKNNNWTFSSTGGMDAFNGWCFLYEYDDKGQTILKKSPGADPLLMVYNKRGLPVFMQDGVQRKMPTPQWTVNLYDQLDRVILTTLYHTILTVTEIQEVIDGASDDIITIHNFGGGGPQLDLLVDQRNVAISAYQAQNSIEFVKPGLYGYFFGTQI
ncbi:MAG: hypothetical protein EOP49_45110 [Sphingobacteriales bacterium]|nr:MAG: hypothetical protein EOP49_45110 [Sphingobacteriales bacterium]